eukprot:134235-Hanusia_phi.AAC.1
MLEREEGRDGMRKVQEKRREVQEIGLRLDSSSQVQANSIFLRIFELHLISRTGERGGQEVEEATCFNTHLNMVEGDRKRGEREEVELGRLMSTCRRQQL